MDHGTLILIVTIIFLFMVMLLAAMFISDHINARISKAPELSETQTKESKMTLYFVKIGGSSISQEFDNIGDAVDACFELACNMAEEQGLDQDDIDVFDNSYGDEIEIGACPSNNDGAYWPRVEKGKR